MVRGSRRGIEIFHFWKEKMIEQAVIWEENMSVKNKWKSIFFKKAFFFMIIFSVSAGIRVQASEIETKKILFETETGNRKKVQSIEMEGARAQYTIVNQEEISAPGNAYSGKAVPKPDSRTALENVGIEDSEKDAVQNTEITLYVLDEDYRPYLSIPDGYLQSYSLSGQTYGNINGRSITISNGSIIPAVEIWYYHQDPDSGYWVGQTNPSGQEGEIIKRRYIYEDSDVIIGGKKVTFHVCDYAQVYSKQVMDQYLDENVHSGMTDYEKAEKCCKFVAGYDYGTESTSYTGLIVMGSGDCWASTNTLLYMFEKLGIDAQSRSASHDPGAASGHYNVLAILDGYYYIVDAGYTGKAPRPYSMRKLSSSDESCIYQVISEAEKTIRITDYRDFGEKIINIPAEINGYTVTEIADKAFYSTEKVEKIVIPNTVKSIGNSAFAYCEKLKAIEIPDSVVSLGLSVFYNDRSLTSIYIPASVEKLTGGMFQSCDSLKEIVVDQKNAYYCSRDNVLFDKNMKTLIAYPPGKSDEEYHVPEGVDTIGEWAFVSCGCLLTEDSSGTLIVTNNGFRKLILPESLRKIGEKAFYSIHVEEVQVQSGVAVIPSYSFQSADVDRITLPDSVTEIESYAFYRAGLKEIKLSEKLETIGEAAFAGNLKMKTTLPSSVQYIGYGAFWLDYGWSSMGAETDKTDGFNNYHNGYVVCKNGVNSGVDEKAFCGGVSLGVIANSQMEFYAAKNGVYYVYVDSDFRCMLKREWFDLKGTVLSADANPKINYKGTQQGMTAAPYNIRRGEDYTLYYNEEKNVARVAAHVTGIGYLKGEVTEYWELSISGDIGETNNALGAPVLESVTVVNGKTTITWKCVKDAEFYRIYYREEGRFGSYDGYFSRINALSKEKMSYVITDRSMVGYEVWVTACKGDMEGAPSAIVKAQIGSDSNVKPDTTNNNTDYKKKKTQIKAKKFQKVCKRSVLKKKNKTYKIQCSTNSKGKATFSKISGNRKITCSKSGKITVKKGIKKGRYVVKVRVKVAATSKYKAAKKDLKLVIRVV